MEQTKFSVSSFVTFVTSVALLIGVQGCATMPDNWAFTKEVVDTNALAQVKRVGVLDVPPPTKIWLGTPSGLNAGFFGPLISQATATHDSDNPATGAFFSETTQKELQDWLEQEGIEVVLLKAERINPSKMLKDYSQFKQVDVDAILDVAIINVGFMGKSFSGNDELSPEVMYTYRLISAKSNQVLIESNVYYSSFYYSSGRGVGTTLVGPSSHLFNDADSVKRQPKEAVKRLGFAIKRATESIAMTVANKN